MVRILTASLAALLLAGSMTFAAPEPESKGKAALTAAQDWLKLIDAGKYEESWKTTAAFFRLKVPLEKWLTSMETSRRPFGATVKREQKSSWFRTKIPSAPDGEYVVFQFETSFANGKTYAETVTPMLDKDGKWRVSGYFVKEAGGNLKVKTAPAPQK